DGPDPGVVFFFAAALVAVEADGVVADLVEEDGETDGRAREGRFDPVDAAAVLEPDAPGAAAHLTAPAFDAHVVAGLHHVDDGVEAETLQADRTLLFAGRGRLHHGRCAID